VPGLDGPPDSGDTSVPEAASWPEPAPWPEVAPWPGAVPAHEAPPDGGMGGGTQERPGGAGGSPLDDPAAPPAMPLASAVLPASSAVVPPAIPPVMPLGAPPQPASVPGPVSVPVRGPGGVAGPGPGPDAVPSGSAFTPPPGPAARGSAHTTPHAGDSGNYGDYGDYERYERYDDEDDEPARLVPTALRRHQRRLLLQTVAILAAIGVLCWWAVTTVSGKSGHPAAAGSTRVSTGQAGLGAPGATTGEPAGSAAPSSAAANQGSATAVAPPPPSAGRPSVPDATTVSSIQVTLLGGSGSVPQIVALISVHTAGTGAVNVTGSYYGASGGSGRVAPEQQSWTFTGKTGYEYSVPISNSAYCGTAFTFTVTAGGRSATQTTAPGC
jgi:hypothetical protein